MRMICPVAQTDRAAKGGGLARRSGGRMLAGGSRHGERS